MDSDEISENENQNTHDDEEEEDVEMDCSEEKAVDEVKGDDDDLKVPLKPQNAKRHKTGVIYLSRVPKGMTVTKLAEILSKYGELGKIYLKPRDGEESKKKSRTYTEGWVEFESKRVAKMVSGMLNNTLIHGKRKNAWYGEPWSMKYMKGVKWNDLQGKILIEKKIQESKIRMAITESKKKVDKFSKDVSREKFLKKLEARGETIQRRDRPTGNVKLTQPWREKPKANNSFLSGLLLNGIK